MSYEKEKKVALEAAISAARLCEQVRRETAFEALEKGDGTPVTLADFGSQAVICRAIAEAFPDDQIVAEEDAAGLRGPDMTERLEKITGYVRGILPEAFEESVIDWINLGRGQVGSRFWAIDPIDGTKGFLRGDQYAVALALIEEGEVRLGVLACPVLLVDPGEANGEKGVLFVGVLGQGAAVSPLHGGSFKAIHVAEGSESMDLPFVESFESSHSDHVLQKEVAESLGSQAPLLRVDGQPKYGIVARGEALAYIRFPLSPGGYAEKIWDHAAGKIIVEEAGGRVTDMHGHALDFLQIPEMIKNEGIVAGNIRIHTKVLETLKAMKQP
ncbi:MAG: 3'(2'),5'-bisphosphate nucleotidase [Deltaproteobacteria bacterium]|nr:3'(2'),5'-bisphosphate nucleotidase [Deltaproteobacteria bacterium]